MRLAHPWLAVVPLLALTSAVPREEYPVRAYVDPAHLDVPWPKHSHEKQPWRAFLETRSGDDFMHGVRIPVNAEVFQAFSCSTGSQTRGTRLFSD